MTDGYPYGTPGAFDNSGPVVSVPQPPQADLNIGATGSSDIGTVLPRDAYLRKNDKITLGLRANFFNRSKRLGLFFRVKSVEYLIP